MLYHDSVAFLVGNQLGIPVFMASDSANNSITSAGKNPAQVAQEFNLSIRGASALLVTLCRMDVVQILKDSDESVDDIVYELTPSARTFLADRNAAAYSSPFADTFCTNFITPEALLECSRPDPNEEKKDLMSEHLEQNDEEVANNARHFMAHMNAQSYCCALALPDAADLSVTNAGANADNTKPMTLLDIGGGSAIYTIEAVRSNPNVNGIIFELPAIKPITEDYIENADLSDRIKVHPGDFFTDEEFPGPVDMVLFSNILHDWPDETNLKLIQKAYNCLCPGGRIAISELLLSDDVKSSTSSATSMNVIMLPYTKGRQYRPKELYRRLERAGFVDPHVTNLVDDYDLVIATKPQ
jgi:SAM-dependent methyltransferase